MFNIIPKIDKHSAIINKSSSIIFINEDLFNMLLHRNGDNIIDIAIIEFNKPI